MRYRATFWSKLLAVPLFSILPGCLSPGPGREPAAETRGKTSKGQKKMTCQVVKSDKEWKKVLSAEQYRVTRQKGTELPFTGKYWNLKARGTYHCVGCGQPLFGSDAKFDSGSGWPSFFRAKDKGAIRLKRDKSHGMVRTETLCSRCGAHLGHLFDDGPAPTGLRYCINSAALDFKKD